MTAPLLEIQNLGKRFGGLHALESVTCRIHAGELKAVIGPNGAGKTTLFNCLTGVDRPTSGSILLEGNRIERLSAHRIAAAGIARTWQTIALFDQMTALENVMVGRHCRTRAGLVGAAFRWPSQRREERRIREDARQALKQLGVEDVADRPVDQLTFLEQRRVELARCLASEPRLLLLDEPAAGLNTRETAELGGIIRDIHKTGTTTVLVEHDISLVMDLADSILVLDHGTPIAEGPPREIQSNPEVISVYLGGELEECSA